MSLAIAFQRARGNREYGFPFRPSKTMTYAPSTVPYFAEFCEDKVLNS